MASRGDDRVAMCQGRPAGLGTTPSRGKSTARLCLRVVTAPAVIVREGVSAPHLTYRANPKPRKGAQQGLGTLERVT